MVLETICCSPVVIDHMTVNLCTYVAHAKLVAIANALDASTTGGTLTDWIANLIQFKLHHLSTIQNGDLFIGNVTGV